MLLLYVGITSNKRSEKLYTLIFHRTWAGKFIVNFLLIR